MAVSVPALTWAITQAPEERRHSLPELGRIPPPVRYSTIPDKPAPLDHAQEPVEILRAIIDRVAPRTVVRARFGDPLPGWTCTDPPSIPCPEELRKGRWLYFTVNAPSLGAASVRPVWEANLIAGALRDEMHMAGIPGDLIASNVSIRLPTGKIFEYVGGLGDAAFEQSFDTSSPSSIEERLRAAAAEVGIEVESVKVYEPLQPAPAVVVSATNPKAFLSRSPQIARKLFGEVGLYEGWYLEAQDVTGEPFLVRAVTFRGGSGTRWIRPDLETGCGTFVCPE